MSEHDERIAEGLGELCEAASERFGPALEEARERLEDWNEKTLRFLKAHPGACLLGALGAGFLVGRLASRR